MMTSLFSDRITNLPDRYDQFTQFPATLIRIRLELDYDKKYFNNVSVSRFAGTFRSEGIPTSGKRRTQTAAIKKEWRKNIFITKVFRKSFSKAHLKKYRESLQLPIIDNNRPGGKEELSTEGKIAFLGLQMT
ncbi:hypothetical protein ACFL5F_02685 [Planctomycetota bacterium]